MYGIRAYADENAYLRVRYSCVCERIARGGFKLFVRMRTNIPCSVYAIRENTDECTRVRYTRGFRRIARLFAYATRADADE